MSLDWEETTETSSPWRAGGGLRLPWKYSLWVPPVVLGLIYLSLTRGYESRHITFAHLSSTASGLTLGNGTVWAFEGQTISVDYDVTELRRGHLRIFIMQDDPLAATR